MAKGKIPNINNKLHGDKLVEVQFSDSTGSLGFDEFNAVLNNVNESVRSNKIMDADYKLNAKVPTNFNNIISGTAQLMEIQDSNYNSIAYTSPRYVGSKTISADYNNYQASGSQVTFADGEVGEWGGDQKFDEYPGVEVFYRGNPLGKVPAIDLWSTHFVLFDRIEINSAILDRDVFHCLYLIDDQGNKTPLSYKNKNLNTLQRLFKEGNNAEVVFLGANNQELLDSYPIERVGIISRNNMVLSNDLFIQDDNNDLFSLGDTSQAVGIGLRSNGVSTSQFNFSYSKYGNNQTTPAASISHRSVRIAPSLFSVSLISNSPNTYKLTYSDSASRDRLISGDNGLSVSNTNIIQVSGSSELIQRYNYITSSIPDYEGSSVTTLHASDGTLISTGTSSYKNPTPYTLNENALDPFYILTYNSQTNKVFEGTIYETIINNAQFDAVNPYQVTNSGILGYANKFLPALSLTNTNQMTPQSFMSQNVPLKAGDFLEFGSYNIADKIASTLVNQDDPYEAIQDNLPITKLITTKVIDIELPGTLSTYVFKYDGLFGTGPNAGTWGCMAATDNLAIAGLDQYMYMVDLYYKPPVYFGYPQPNPTALALSMQGYSGSFISLVNEPGDPIPPVYFPVYTDPVDPTYYTSVWTSGSYYNPIWNHNSFAPGDMYGIIINKNTTGYIDYTAFGNPLDKLTHGDVIEFCLLSDFGPANSFNNNEPLPDDKIWRYMVMNPCDNNVLATSLTTLSSPDAYRYYLTYLNGHNGENIPSSNGWDFGNVPTSGNWDLPSDSFVIYQISKQTSDPSITVEVTNGSGDLIEILENSGSIMTKSDVKQHEQYIESQYLKGTGVGVLIPSDFKPELRDQLPDIIKKTNIDIDSLL